MKIKSIILSFVLATTMTGCAELNNTLHVLAQQAEIYRNGTGPDTRFKMLWLRENRNYCYGHYNCQQQGKGFESFAHLVVNDPEDFEESRSIHIGNNVAKLAWAHQKCINDGNNPITCKRKYEDKIETIFKNAGGKSQYNGKIITTDI